MHNPIIYTPPSEHEKQNKLKLDIYRVTRQSIPRNGGTKTKQRITMEIKIDFLQWLSKKLYFTNAGLYATIIIIMVLPTLLTKAFGIPQTAARLAVFFIVPFIRAAYESLVIYEAPIKSLSLPKMLFLSATTASSMFFAAHFLKPKLGYFSIPVSIIIAMIVVGKLKAKLWPSAERPGFFHNLPTKLEVSKRGMYGFYAILVSITYITYNKYHIDFSLAFAAAFLVGVIFEEAYNMIHVYNQPITPKIITTMVILASVCAIIATAIVWVMIGMFDFDGKTATITSVVLLKLIQPLGSRKFILGV